MGVYRTISEINGDLSRKSQDHVFCAPADCVPLGIEYWCTESKKLE